MIEINGQTQTKKTLKTKSSKRAIPLSDFLKTELLSHYNLSIPSINNQICANVFLEELKPDYFTHKFHKIMEKQFDIQMREHDLRHTFSQLIHDNEDILLDKSRLMGHSQIEITKNIYTKNSITKRMFDIVNALADELCAKMCEKKCESL